MNAIKAGPTQLASTAGLRKVGSHQNFRDKSNMRAESNNCVSTYAY